MLYMSHFYVFGVLIGTTAINLIWVHILLNSWTFKVLPKIDTMIDSYNFLLYRCCTVMRWVSVAICKSRENRNDKAWSYYCMFSCDKWKTNWMSFVHKKFGLSFLIWSISLDSLLLVSTDLRVIVFANNQKKNCSYFQNIKKFSIFSITCG